MKSTKFFTSDVDYVVRIYEQGVSLNKILLASEDKADSSYYTKIQSYPQPTGLHETMKPLELIEKYILLSSNEGNVVLDPFLGSGTTAIACVNTNRHYIGFEKESKYFDIACTRLDEVESR